MATGYVFTRMPSWTQYNLKSDLSTTMQVGHG